jgi:hypothetical protein
MKVRRLVRNADCSVESMLPPSERRSSEKSGVALAACE